jgi:hypothetical protein
MDIRRTLAQGELPPALVGYGWAKRLYAREPAV